MPTNIQPIKPTLFNPEDKSVFSSDLSNFIRILSGLLASDSPDVSELDLAAPMAIAPSRLVSKAGRKIGRGMDDIGRMGKKAVHVSPTGKPFDEQMFPAQISVRVEFPNGQVFEDAVRGMNVGHALGRAVDNWPGAKIQVIGTGLSENAFTTFGRIDK